MFKQLFSALKSSDVLDQAFSQFAEMLDHAQWMFLRANEVLQRQSAPEDLRDSLYRMRRAGSNCKWRSNNVPVR